MKQQDLQQANSVFSHATRTTTATGTQISRSYGKMSQEARSVFSLPCTEFSRTSKSPSRRDYSARDPLNQQSQCKQSPCKNPNKTDLMSMDDLKIITKPIISKRCTIKRLGLNLRPICQYETHENYQINHICIDPACDIPDKLCCEKCLKDVHPNHEIEEIEKFTDGLESTYRVYTTKAKEFQLQCLMVEQPPFIGKIFKELNKLKDYIHKKIESMKTQIIGEYRRTVQGDVRWLKEEVRKQEYVADIMGTILSKNLFDLTESELETSIQMHDSERTHELELAMKNLQYNYSKIEKQFNFSYASFKNDIIFDIDTSFKEFILPEGELDTTKVEKSSTRSPSALLMSQKINDKSKETNDLGGSLVLNKSISKVNKQNSIKESPSTQKSSSGKDGTKFDSPNRNNSLPHGDNKVERLKLIMAELDKDIKDKSKRLKSLKDALKQPEVLSKSNSKDFENFPYFTYFEATCEHMPSSQENFNAIPIFQCCNQAYRCVKCHGKFTNHPATVQANSKRYCVKCFEIFTVTCKEDKPVCCLECKNLPD